jgi:tetratricopeptide (TPR) repeat protein
MGDWIVVLDADEVLRDAAGLRAWLEQSPADVTGVQVAKENYGPDGGCTLRWYQLVAWRRGLYRYMYREHEYPLACVAGQDYHEIQIDAVIEHHPPQTARPGKADIMLTRLRADVEQWPDHPHPAYFLHRQYALMEKWQECLAAGEHYLAIAGDNDRCECYGNMAIAAQRLGDVQAAIDWLHRAAALQPQRRMWWVRLAEIYADGGEWNLASALCHCALELWPSQHWQVVLSVEHTLLYDLLLRCQHELAHGAMHAHEHGGT